MSKEINSKCNSELAGAVVRRTIRLLKCDTARITSPCKIHYMIIGCNRNTMQDYEEFGTYWEKNNALYHFEYVREQVIASGKTFKELWESIKYYKSLLNKECV